jgi:hypothetical protein
MDQVGQEQARDAYCQTLTVGSANGRSALFKDEDGVIYRRNKQETPLLVLPQSVVKEILHLNHSSVYASHPGKHRMLAVLKA